MSATVIALDLGTGGAKAAVYAEDGTCVAERVAGYETFYPSASRHEQRPLDWWEAVCGSIAALLAAPGVDPASVKAIALSGHSLGCVPLDADGELLQEFVPIWSDGRADAVAQAFFEKFDKTEWYRTTGNGFPAPLYTVFKIHWLRNNAPEIFARTRTIIGTKDYINFRLTGRIATDHSYASGTGVYDLEAQGYSSKLLAGAELSPELMPTPLASTEIVGEVLPAVAEKLGLPAGVKVIAGGVDNSCMALGASTFGEGDAFISMGSSSWLTVSSTRPLLDDLVLPYVFAHVVPGKFISATSIFSSGTSLTWVREQLMADVVAAAEAEGLDVHDALMELALSSPRGARGLLFVPTLAGGTSLEGGSTVRGGFLGLDLQHGRADMMRATFEGIALALRVALDELRRMTPLRSEMIVVGGGARSAAWRQMFADILGCAILKASVDQQAATLGAAALAFVGMGIWPDFSPLRAICATRDVSAPDTNSVKVYEAALAAYRDAAAQQRALAPALSSLRALSV
jgi:xylulokinase